jgi:low affinity Fe/Cu permease
MKNWFQRLTQAMKGESGQAAILWVIEIAIAVYIAIVLIRYLIIPALVGP